MNSGIYTRPISPYNPVRVQSSTTNSPRSPASPININDDINRNTRLIYNELLYTNDFSNGVWSKTGLTVSTASDSTDFFTTSFNKITVAATGNTLIQTVNIIATNYAHLSLYLKCPTSKSIRVEFIEVAPSSNTVYTEGVVNNWWTRIELALEFGAMSQVRMRIVGVDAGDFYIYAPQIIAEQTDFKMYLPSTGARGSYKVMTRLKRFKMMTNITSIRATPMITTPVDDTTSQMIEPH